jgi:hypothetical protein
VHAAGRGGRWCIPRARMATSGDGGRRSPMMGRERSRLRVVRRITRLSWPVPVNLEIRAAPGVGKPRNLSRRGWKDSAVMPAAMAPPPATVPRVAVPISASSHIGTHGNSRGWSDSHSHGGATTAASAGVIQAIMVAAPSGHTDSNPDGNLGLRRHCRCQGKNACRRRCD